MSAHAHAHARSRPLRGAVGAIAAVFAVACGCAANAPALAGTVDLPLQVGGAFSVRVQSLQERRNAATVRQQHDYSCGSAAVSTLLTHHYGNPVGEAQVFNEMLALGDADVIRRDGFSLLDMKRYLAAHGFDADGFEADLASLSEAGLPAIVLVNEKGYNHFVVIKGLRGGRVLFGDPAQGTRAMSLARFEAIRVNPILFVIANRQQAARFNSDAEWAALPAAPLAGRADGAATVGALPKLGVSDF